MAKTATVLLQPSWTRRVVELESASVLVKLCIVVMSALWLAGPAAAEACLDGSPAGTVENAGTPPIQQRSLGSPPAAPRGLGTPPPRLVGPALACVSAAETRDLFVANKLVAPGRVMRDVTHATRAEAIDIQLCRLQGQLVYNVTLLDGQGRIVRRLVGATNGEVLAGHPPQDQGRGEKDEREPPRAGER